MQADSGEVTSGLVTNSWTTRRVMKLNTGDRCSTVQYSAVQYSTVQYSTVQELSCWAGVRMLHVFSAHHSAHV